MDQAGAALAALQNALPAIGGALSPLVVPLLGLAALVLAAWVGTRKAAKINAAARTKIASINAENSQQIERIKADAQRKLEREKFNREWRRQRVTPPLDKLEELRKDDMGVLAAALASPVLRPSLLDQSTREITQGRFTIYADLTGLCPPELSERFKF
jgi:hypothetical protein